MKYILKAKALISNMFKAYKATDGVMQKRFYIKEHINAIDCIYRIFFNYPTLLNYGMSEEVIIACFKGLLKDFDELIKEVNNEETHTL